MAEFKDMLKYFRKRDGYSQSELAQKLGLSTSTISMYEIGKREPSFEIEERIADFFNIGINTLRGKDMGQKSPCSAIDLPVLGQVAAGNEKEDVEEIVDHIDISQDFASKGEFFGLLIKGDSMIPTLCDGDTVIVEKTSDAESGDLVVASVNDSVGTCKRLQKYAEGLALIPINPAYEPMRFTKDEINSTPVRILGKVVEMRRKF